MKQLKYIGKYASYLFTTIVAYSLFNTQLSYASIDSDAVFNAIKHRYKSAMALNTFHVDYHSEGLFASQTYNYNCPQLSKRRQMIDIDLINNLYFSRVIRGPFPGNYIFDTSEFQRPDLKARYDNNYVLHGKRVIERKLDNPITLEIEKLTMVLDIMAVKALLEIPKLKDVTHIQQLPQKERLALHIKTTDDQYIQYIFNAKTYDLLSVKNPAKNYTTLFAGLAKQGEIRYAQQARVTKGDHTSHHTINQLSAIDKIPANKLKIPKGYGPIINRFAKDVTIEKIAPALFLLSNVDLDRHVMVKEYADTLSVFGAPNINATKEVITLLKRHFPTKRIDTVYVSHPYSGHISGLLAYIELGATIVADAYTASVIKSYPHYKLDLSKVKFKVFSHGDLVKGVQYFIPKNSHAKSQSFAYFREDKIIYEADLLNIPFDNTIPTHMPDIDKEFIEFVYANNLEIKRIVGHHRNGNISKTTMDSYYQRHHGHYKQGRYAF